RACYFETPTARIAGHEFNVLNCCTGQPRWWEPPRRPRSLESRPPGILNFDDLRGEIQARKERSILGVDAEATYASIRYVRHSDSHIVSKSWAEIRCQDH